MPVTKAIAAIQPGSDDPEFPNGSFDIILSAQTRDRDGDVFKASEWKQPLPEWIPIDIDHAMSVEKTVGSGHPFINDDGDLQVRGGYASTELAQQVRTLVGEGHCRFVSVAVMTDKSLKDGTPNRELLNGAFVNTPSNREAVVLASKGVNAKAGARNSASDSQMITAIHDAAVALGAACVEPAPSAADGSAEGANKAIREAFVIGKALSGSLEDLRDRVTDALQDVVGDDCWAWIRATFLDDSGTSGTIVYDLGEETFSRTFTIVDSLVTLGTTIEAVTLVTSVAPADPQVDDDPSDAVEGAAEEHDAEIDARSFDNGGLSSFGTYIVGGGGGGGGAAGNPIYSPKDVEAFKAALDAITKTSGVAGSPQSPAGSPADAPAEPVSTAAPQGPAVETAEAAADAAVKAAEQVALDKTQLSHLKARIYASNARLAAS